MHTEIAEITAIPENLAEQTRALYERSFHVEELRNFDDLVAGLGRDGIGRARWLLATKGDSVLGLSIFKYCPEARFGYLWYLCVDESTRGTGIGGRLYSATVERLRTIAKANGQSLKGMMFEISRLDSESHPVYGDPHRRLRFYERLGARMILGYDYWQPAIPPHPKVPLQLMFHPVDLPEPACTSDELVILVRDFMLHCQGTEAGPISDLRLKVPD